MNEDLRMTNAEPQAHAQLAPRHSCRAYLPTPVKRRLRQPFGCLRFKGSRR